MSEKEKKNAPQEEQPQANTTPETEQAAEKAAEEETFTVTREQMEQMELTARVSNLSLNTMRYLHQIQLRLPHGVQMCRQ